MKLQGKWCSRRWLLLVALLVWTVCMLTYLIYAGVFENLAIVMFTGSVGAIITFILSSTKEKIQFLKGEIKE